MTDSASSAAQPGMTCCRPDPPPQLFLFGSLLECAPPGWAISQEHRSPKGRDVVGPVPPYWTMEDKAFNT